MQTNFLRSTATSIGDAAKRQVSWPPPTCAPELLPVRLERIFRLFSPFLKQSRIVLELKQHGSNLLGFRHAFVRGVKAGFLVCTLGICQVPQPPNISIAHFESSCADVQDITPTH